MVKISVIIPIYKVESFIARCAESLFNQTFDEGIEYIFVDDASPDDSVKILQDIIAEYPNRFQQVKILHHKFNQGLPAARNTGLAEAIGEYVFHFDSDDYADPDMLETLYRKAIERKADIVWCDWFLSFERNERYMKQPSYSTSFEALKAMLSGAMKYNVWNKLVRRSLYVDNHIVFPSGYGMGEDMTMMLLFAYAKQVVYVPKAFYHYVKLNNNALTQTCSIEQFDALRHNVQWISEHLEKKYGEKLVREIAFLKLEAKFPFLIMDDDKFYNLWKQWYPEANKYIWENKYISLRSRCLQWLACKNQFWGVRLYCAIVLRFIYGIIYK